MAMVVPVSPDDWICAVLQKPLQEEIDVMQAVLDGQKDQTIARRLGISVITVRRRVSRFLHQVGAKNRIQGAVVGVQRGWLNLDLDDGGWDQALTRHQDGQE